MTFRRNSGNIVRQLGEVAQRWSSGLISHRFWVQIPASPFSFLGYHPGSGFTPEGYCTNPSLAILYFKLPSRFWVYPGGVLHKSQPRHSLFWTTIPVLGLPRRGITQIPPSPFSILNYHPGSGFTPEGYCTNPSLAIFCLIQKR